MVLQQKPQKKAMPGKLEYLTNNNRDDNLFFETASADEELKETQDSPYNFKDFIKSQSMAQKDDMGDLFQLVGKDRVKKSNYIKRPRVPQAYTKQQNYRIRSRTHQ